MIQKFSSLLLKPRFSEAVVQRCSVKTVFLEILQNSQENTRASLFFNKVADLVLLRKSPYSVRIQENTDQK